MFEIGEKILCIDAAMKPHTIQELTKDGNQYTVRGFTNNNGIVDEIWLEEIRNNPLFFKLINRPQEPEFALWRFEKLKPEEIQTEVKEKETII